MPGHDLPVTTMWDVEQGTYTAERAERLRAVEAGHQTLAALIHAGVESDQQSTPEGFARARELGLLNGTRLTPLGSGVLRALGLYGGEH